MEFLLHSPPGTGSGATDNTTKEAEKNKCFFFCECPLPVLQKWHLICAGTLICGNSSSAAVSHRGRIPLTEGKTDSIGSMALICTFTGCGIALLTLVVNQGTLS